MSVDAVVTVLYASGMISCCGGGGAFNGPDGRQFAGGRTDLLSWDGVAGIVHESRTMFLAGVFTDGTNPNDPAADRLTFPGTDDFLDL